MRAGLVALLLGALVAAPARADDLDERVPAQPGGLLEIDLDLGEGLRPDPGALEIRSHDAAEVRLVADASGWGASGVAFRLDREGATVRLYGRVKGTFAWLFGGPHVHVQVWVPRAFSLDLRCSTGPIRVEDVVGSVRARTRDASIEVSGVEGPLRLRTTEGDVRVSEVVGAVDVRTTEGAIEIGWVTGDVEARNRIGSIEARHVAGRARLRTDRGEIEVHRVSGPLEAKTERGSIFASFAGPPEGVLETRRGSVELVLPNGAGVQLDAAAPGGAVELAPALGLSGTPGGEAVAGPINGGGPAIRLYTAQGRIRVVTQ